ncbi:MAG: bile acid:sodium symporter [Ancrocorticia sp.]
MQRAVQWMERLQIPLYLAALVVGAAVGLAAPHVAPIAERTINLVLGALLYATFLGVPFARMGQALRDWRFLLTILGVNFLIVPAVVFALTRVIAHDHVLLVPALFVLLTPCVDYVMVFTGIAGGANDRLLASSPLLMALQMLLLPLYLWLMVGADVVAAVDLGPFVEAFVVLIVVPLALAILTQLAAVRTSLGRTIADVVAALMVPLMMVTLAVVVASQVAGVSHELGALIAVVPVYILFAVIMLIVGKAASAWGGLDVPGQRAVVFSGVTRNSLVVLPLVLSLPEEYGLAPLVVVTQTLVELVVMVIFVRLVPRVIPAGSSGR